MPPSVSIIIPTCNEGKFIERTLKSIQHQLEEGDEIIIVDYNSKDDTIDICKRYGCKTLIFPEKGVGKARNHGVENAETEIIAFLDADVMAHKSWLKLIKKFFEDKPNTPVVCGCDLYLADSIFKRAIYNMYSILIFYMIKIAYIGTKIPCIVANNSAFSKEAYLEHGGYPTTIGDEVGIARNFKGVKDIIYDSDVKVYLSDRRFTERGFLTILGIWARGSVRAIFGQQFSG
ncbi:MAG: glycosyltransferase family 2 protein [Thermoplasmata archaeon]